MNHISKTGLVSAIAALGLIISPISALALTVGATGSTDAAVQTGVNVGASSNTSGTASSSTAGSNTSAGDTASGDVTGSLGVTLSANAQGVVVSTPAQVSSDSDLAVYSSNVVKSNDSVRAVDTSSSDKVSVSYTHQGRFLGIFPVRVTSKTDVAVGVDGKAVVTTHMPWWNIFVTGTHTVSSDVDSSLSSSSSVAANLSANASASERARVVEDIINAHAQADAQAAASANSSAQNL